MKAWFSRIPLYLTLVIVSASVGGCGESKEASNVPPSPAASPDAFPSPSVPVTLKNQTKVALTRPTNPDDRLRVIKSGRNDPFSVLVPPKSTETNVPNRFASGGSNFERSFPPGMMRSFNRGSSGSSGSSGPKEPLGRGLPSFNRPGSSNPGGINLPTLPSAVPSPEPAPEVKVTGVVDLMGQARAIVQAPGEPTSRTVSVGDVLNGGLRVTSIVADRNSPYVIFQRGTQSFEVGVGREPVLMASSRLPAFGSRP